MTEQTEREVIEALFFGEDGNLLCHKERLFSERPGGFSEVMHRANRFTAMLDAGAYLDAAMMLVPEGFEVDLTIGKYWPCRARLVSITKDGDRWLHRGCDPHYCENADTPALALCEAIRAAKDAADA